MSTDLHAATLSITTKSPHQLDVIDAANLGIDFIESCAAPLAHAIAHLPCENHHISQLAQLLAQQAQEYHAMLAVIRDQHSTG